VFEETNRKRTDNTMAKKRTKKWLKKPIENGQTTQRPKEKQPTEKQRSTKHYAEK
jgi:hypothetical protein